MIFDKAITINDLHFGRNSNSVQANQDNLDFLDWAIDEAKTFGADTCIMMGDWHDNRSSISVLTLDYSRRAIEKLNANFKTVYWFPGNHDLFYRDKRDVTSISFAQHLSNIKFVTKPTTIGSGKDGVTFLPWLVGNEHKACGRIDSRYVFGHLELNGGFLMNAKVPMPDHDGNIDTDSFKKPEFVFTGHFHFRQAKNNVVYTGNIMPFNFADSWDEERGIMMLEWGKEPDFKAWDDQPTFRTMTLSDLLTKPDQMLKQKTTARVTLDMDISYEEAQVIRDQYAKEYGVRKIELVPVARQSVSAQEFQSATTFQSVDQIVIDGLLSVQSDSLDKNKLVDIYNKLD